MVQKVQTDIFVFTKKPKRLLPDTFPNFKIYQNAFAAGRHEKLIALPRPPSGHFLADRRRKTRKGRKGKKEEATKEKKGDWPTRVGWVCPP